MDILQDHLVRAVVKKGMSERKKSSSRLDHIIRALMVLATLSKWWWLFQYAPIIWKLRAYIRKLGKRVRRSCRLAPAGAFAPKPF